MSNGRKLTGRLLAWGAALVLVAALVTGPLLAALWPEDGLLAVWLAAGVVWLGLALHTLWLLHTLRHHQQDSGKLALTLLGGMGLRGILLLGSLALLPLFLPVEILHLAVVLLGFYLAALALETSLAYRSMVNPNPPSDPGP